MKTFSYMRYQCRMDQQRFTQNRCKIEKMTQKVENRSASDYFHASFFLNCHNGWELLPFYNGKSLNQMNSLCSYHRHLNTLPLTHLPHHHCWLENLSPPFLPLILVLLVWENLHQEWGDGRAWFPILLYTGVSHLLFDYEYSFLCNFGHPIPIGICKPERFLLG